MRFGFRLKINDKFTERGRDLRTAERLRSGAMDVLRRLQELELLQPISKNGKATTYAWRRLALAIRRDSHRR